MDERTEAMLIELATKLGTTVEYLWSALLRQATIEGYVSLAGTIAATVIFIAAWVTVSREMRVGIENEEDITGHIAFRFFGAIIFAAVFFGLAGPAATCLLNPEYWALKQVLP